MNKCTFVVMYAIALLLASVTAVSVSLSVYALLENKIFALLFSFAAVLLDLFKYLAWSVVARLVSKLAVAGIMFCAVILGGVSGWSTYDRLHTSINDSKQQVTAMVQERVVFLKERVASDAALLKRLDTDSDSFKKQAGELRSRGVVSKALELEEVSGARITSERNSAIERMNVSSLEITHIESSSSKASSLTPLLTNFLCLGFSLALEIVPALILLAVRESSKTAVAPDELSKEVCPLSEKQGKPVAPSEKLASRLMETLPEPGNTSPASELKTLEKALKNQGGAYAETQKTVETGLPENEELLVSLKSEASYLETGTPLPLKEWAKKSHIGNVRAGVIYREAVSRGYLKKTTLGYVVA
ncbi:hypothetical protein [Pseudomonas sp. CJQ_13]|uniref:hypothetical protein n=1 Tax=Pseudomonas sp. CJQ_13 TaxID=3367170 RepID=UPI00370C4184